MHRPWLSRRINDENKINASIVTTSEAPEISSTVGLKKKLVYMEDLKKALDEFEKKLDRGSSTTNSNQYASTNHFNQNVNRIMEILKKGVHVETSVPEPHDENLDWIQIKIPKDM
ncbi:uncharacterized protein LOC114248948 [Bombyx mandarina]|uniref:Uncharacterized protein LOC114248948 n=1 Tax=Bombyx mandarina TaxID=7092 RepID=A0A6J2K7C9_BOMMA|nr:uncharacterized protein LOC114248948 [Bombyx mandarina]